ncbi:MAG: right-handed parallel beta-helix repeat-containing protein [Candidatus Omnitrophica bacterium]|nr:right-handed parallel beta-helix repeat-containing protein [Candidatus Omnitrophota bacterium]
MKRYSIFLAGLMAMLAAGSTSAGEFYVAPTGRDTYPGTRDQPFATLARARDAIRAVKKAETGSFTVFARAGTYYLDHPLVLGPEDSGKEGAPIVYSACGNETVVLSGGRALTGWKPYRGRIWQCDLGKLDLKGLVFKDLYYNGRRQPAARVPNFDPEHPRTGGFLYVADGGQRGSKRLLKYPPSKLAPEKWAHPEQAEVNVFPYHNWDNNIIQVAGVDPKQHLITLNNDASYELIWDTRFYVFNVLEELDTPGEWCLNPESGTLYFWPPDNQFPQNKVIVPVVETLIDIHGDTAQGKNASHLEVRGFILEDCRGPAVRLAAADHCALTKCIIRNVGYPREAVLVNSANDNRLAGNDIYDTGSGGIAINGDRNQVSNNAIHDIGVSLKLSPAITVAGCSNFISHNLVHDVPNRGIDFTGHDNVIEYNEIHHFGLESNVPGGIYAYAKDHPEIITGTIIRYNKITDAVGYGMMSFGDSVGQWGPNQGFGIWLDDMVSDTTIFGNILVRNRGGGVVIHGGANNLVENNILGAGISGDINHLRPDRTPCNNRILRNIVYYANADPHMLWLYGWTQQAKARAARGDAIPVFFCGWSFVAAAATLSDYNLLYPIHGKTIEYLYCFRGMSRDLVTGEWVNPPVTDRFAWWREQGFEAHSMIGDPVFVDAAHDDYRLSPDSPALKLGFKPIPVEQIGLQADADRATWPVDSQQDIWREQPLLHP